MRSTLNVSLNKITQDQGIYPRFNTDYVRVYLFTELMELGEKFPPVKVVKNGDFYVLLDGNHRLEARKRLCKEKIAADVFDIPERLWRLAAARFNGKSSMPLKGDELKRVIENAWEIDGIRDTYEIAHELGCTDRYVRKVLKPIRDKERQGRALESLVSVPHIGQILTDSLNCFPHPGQRDNHLNFFIIPL